MTYNFDWGILWQTPYLNWILHGIWITLVLTLASSILSFATGVCLAFMTMSRSSILYLPARAYIHIARNLPGLFWILFFYFVFPELIPASAGAALNSSSYYPIIAGILGLTVDNSPYVAEIFRSGVSAVSPGQWESAMASGLTPFQLWTRILLPQAMRISAGPLGTRLIHNFKNTSLCMAIAVPEMTWASRQIESLTFSGIEALTAATVFYVVLGLMLATLVNHLDTRFNNQVRSKADQ